MSNPIRYNSNLKCENIVIVYEKKQRQLYENHNLRAQNVLRLGNIFLNRGAKPSPKILLGNSSHLVHQFKIRLEFFYAISIYYMNSRGSYQQTRVLARFKTLVPPISRATKEAIQRNFIESRN